jgi:hypothetical protein
MYVIYNLAFLQRLNQHGELRYNKNASLRYSCDVTSFDPKLLIIIAKVDQVLCTHGLSVQPF